MYCRLLGRSHGIHTAAQEGRAPARWETYDPVAFANYYRYRPLSVAFRALTIVSEIAMLAGWHWIEKSVQKRADNVIFQLICTKSKLLIVSHCYCWFEY